jgi:glutaconate CoA-transferase subunit B
VSNAPAWDPADLMPIVMARLLHDGEIVFHGVNSILPMVTVALARRLHAPRITSVNIAGGIDPSLDELPRSTTDALLTIGSPAIVDNEDFYDLCMRGGIDVAFLGAAQVDGQGRTNVSVIGSSSRPRVRLPGGGGAAVIMPTARRVILSRTEHSRRSFVEKLDFVTAAGNVDRVVTPLCVFASVAGQLRVDSVHPGVTVDTLVERTEFEICPEDPPTTPPPSADELSLLRQVDPSNVRRLEFGA